MKEENNAAGKPMCMHSYIYNILYICMYIMC